MPVPGAAALGLDGGRPPAPTTPPPLIFNLGTDGLLEVFLRLRLRDVARCAAVCRGWRAASQLPQLYREAGLAVAEWSSTDAARHCDRFFCGDWRLMWRLRPRLRTDGLYCSRNTYTRRGTVELSSRTPIHLVRFFRYYAFSASGSFLYRTTPAPPATQRVLSRPRAALREDGVLSGDLLFNEGRLHTIIALPHGGSLTRLHTYLRLRSTCPAANNRLDVFSMLSVDDGAEEPEEPDFDGFDGAYLEDGGLGWHAARGGLGGWNNGTVRTFDRGMTPYVFLTWDELATSELNLDTEQMDFYRPG